MNMESYIIVVILLAIYFFYLCIRDLHKYKTVWREINYGKTTK